MVRVMKFIYRKKLYVLLASLALIVCGVSLFVVFGGNGKEVSNHSSKVSQSEVKDREDNKKDKVATLEKEDEKLDSEKKDDGKKDDEKKAEIEDPGEVIVRPSQETGATENTKTPAVNNPQTGNTEAPKKDNSQTGNTEAPKEDNPQTGNTETPDESDVIELPFVPIN